MKKIMFLSFISFLFIMIMNCPQTIPETSNKKDTSDNKNSKSDNSSSNQMMSEIPVNSDENEATDRCYSEKYKMLKKSYRIAVIDCYSYSDKKRNVRLVETDRRIDYTSENGGVIYVSNPSQGIMGGIFTKNSLYLTDDKPDPSSNDHDYLMQIDFKGNQLKKIDLGNDNAPQEMIIGNDGFIYLPYILEAELMNAENLAIKPLSGIKKINIATGEISDFEKSYYGQNDIGPAFISKIKNKVYVSYFGYPPPFGKLYTPSKVKILNASTMQLISTIDLDEALSTQCQNPTNAVVFNNNLYIACWYNPTTDERYKGPGAIVKVDSNNNKSVIELKNYSAKKIISTANHLYAGLQNWDSPKMDYYFDNVFEIKPKTFTIDEQKPVDTHGYRIFHFEVLDNKIICTAEKYNKHFVIIADENFRILKAIEIYKNANYPKILCAAIK